MGKIAVHEFISLDGVFEDPSWTFEWGFADEMGETLGAITGASDTILLGRITFEMFAPAWSPRTAEQGTIAAQSRPATMIAKEAVAAAFEMPLEQGLLFERRAFHALFSTRDQKEGMAAFAEKRKPRFEDR